MRKALTAVTGLLALLATLLLVVGPVWEQLERRRAIRDFPASGHAIDIGGRQIQMDCRGVGTPTVVFESGLDLFGSLSWAKVQDEVAKFTRACAYSRAGIIWSDDKDGPHDGEGVARDLHAALATAGESGPFVMTGHSIGGPYITTYTKLYGDEVSGLVYVDASHPDQFERFGAALGKPLEVPMLMKVAKIAQGLSWTGIVRLGAAVLGGDGPNVPREALKISSAFASKSLGPFLLEWDAIPATLDAVRAFRRLGARPIAVLTQMIPTPEPMSNCAARSKDEESGLDGLQDETRQRVWLELQNDIASWSVRSTHRIVCDAGHYIQFDRPDAVVAAILDVVSEVRSDSPSRAPGASLH
jgi:pimeloyl-ACP methyl ester carboxylesterase